LLVGVAGTLLALPGTATLAQEADIPEAEELTEPVEDVANDVGDKAGAVGDKAGLDLDQLAPEEVKGQAPSAGTAGSGEPVVVGVSSPAGTSTRGERASAPRRAGTRRQSADQRPQITVRKTNDADGNGLFSPSEVAPRSGADVPFRVTIRNVGQRAVTIRQITDSYDATRVDVCGELIGDQLRSGQRTQCTFVLGDYSPPEFDSRSNTIEVTATGRGGGRVSRSALSAVTTIPGSGDEVLGTGERNPGGEGRSEGFAFTGAYLDRLLGLGAALILAGALLIRAGRRLAPTPGETSA
jgi:hypothetical protein